MRELSLESTHLSISVRQLAIGNWQLAMGNGQLAMGNGLLGNNDPFTLRQEALRDFDQGKAADAQKKLIQAANGS